LEQWPGDDAAAVCEAEVTFYGQIGNLRPIVGFNHLGSIKQPLGASFLLLSQFEPKAG
jgi:hypothetical protein